MPNVCERVISAETETRSSEHGIFRDGSGHGARDPVVDHPLAVSPTATGVK